MWGPSKLSQSHHHHPKRQQQHHHSHVECFETIPTHKAATTCDAREDLPFPCTQRGDRCKNGQTYWAVPSLGVVGLVWYTLRWMLLGWFDVPCVGCCWLGLIYLALGVGLVWCIWCTLRFCGCCSYAWPYMFFVLFGMVYGSLTRGPFSFLGFWDGFTIMTLKGIVWSVCTLRSYSIRISQ